MQIQQLMEKAKERTEQISKADWKLQLEQLNAIVKEVNSWQKKLFSEYGIPTDENSDWSRAYMKAKPYNHHQGNFRFNGAMITQYLDTKETEIATEIIYQANLHVDENYFLQQMLPDRVIQQVDPIYKIYNIKITVPKGELIKESLNLLHTPKISIPYQLRLPKYHAIGLALSGITIISIGLATHSILGILGMLPLFGAFIYVMLRV